MLARLGLPSSKKKYEESITGVHAYRQKYQDALLLPKRELQKLDLSPPKSKRHQYRHRLQEPASTKPTKTKELSNEENDAVWRRWKQRKADVLAKQKQEDDTVLASLQERAPKPGDAEAQFERWKEKKREADRAERQRKKAEQAAWDAMLAQDKAKRREMLHEKVPPMAHAVKTKKLPEPETVLHVLEQVQASPYSKRLRGHKKPAAPLLPQILLKARPRPSTCKGPPETSGIHQSETKASQRLAGSEDDNNNESEGLPPLAVAERIPRPTTSAMAASTSDR
ncbi:hypothetical protein SPRG_02124 [Saprolegnia parasitica CBS 223.65]|uniref:Uncharacterized protein n=1 Tax=Saprolegnia parasitica (strain CBS 223.65) TaxID=695850 RepID=A0A067CVN2_SAPPC|nr:hypothetical protein SPRG_02124 [Saprolegnia parasitica CBS 223.65]KDO33315.1 hypothetical protein SPRG_02124 [Saprolegnia parasitica CBS 223.65]|eukprot:XP_012196065.1 hypothetical protein SPRG_02124 [Saprolegnia parasitica CBS 223.65]